MRTILLHTSTILLLALFTQATSGTAHAEGPAYHVVLPGQTLLSIAAWYGTSIQALAQANQLWNPDFIYAGQVLVIPDTQSTQTLPAAARQEGSPPSGVAGSATYHTVLAGETLTSIAAMHGVSTWSLAQTNGLSDPDLIYASQVLVIPRAGSCCNAPRYYNPNIRAGSANNSSKPNAAAFNRVKADDAPKPPAFKMYKSTSTGYDISFPQCRTGYPSQPRSFVIVGVTSGRAFRPNPCFSAEYKWAASTSDLPPSIYMNLNYAVGSTAYFGLSGPAGDCDREDDACIAYNYGYNAAKNSFEYADPQSAKTWWLDIENSNSWSPRIWQNDQVIQGAIDLLQSKGVTIGVYSSKSQWNAIAGSNFRPRLTNQSSLANWVLGASSLSTAPNRCSADYAFGGGTVWLVQYPAGDYDGNYVC